MTVPKSIFGLLGLAVAALAAGYLLIPAPGATALPPPAPKAVTASAPAPAARPAPTVAANRPPVPLVTRSHANYFTSPSIEGTQAEQANGTQQALLAEPKSGNDSKARAAIELDGYKSVRGLVKDADGVWRGRAMRGRTEIAIRVNPDGSVSAD